ncbi:hypothetical protein SAMN05519104_3608 [Rhizobiales bacterium GAS188]|jgi:hypothetical protein|nr:hypothetical protein SAMN05519104_3608 [Rhizobiales bacterium GAS188]
MIGQFAPQKAITATKMVNILYGLAGPFRDKAMMRLYAAKSLAWLPILTADAPLC